jgi:hypothetical protein
MRELGGRATGKQIADYMLLQDPTLNGYSPKMLIYKINGILSARKNSRIFAKKEMYQDGVKKSPLWNMIENETQRITDEESDHSISDIYVEDVDALIDYNTYEYI